ncbi:N(6)-hydroxylysine O-acetyltransferase [Daldinia childiae]|uniref:N(6)-hydroxylysine O-acetyltransferase n=1 Tax=Daldinia childiae TaxID=326645 RepID=UPI0014458A6F|nr:N(6)-hydroxylysine O-acetyltransferase [Daldinia childiae]KAF3070649.1 N(6)-hydroxylysine O-acetyltransferase [Daldinia childiae]
MAPSIVHLPDGQSFTVQPVFSGLFFKSNELNHHHGPFPVGWTVVIHSEDHPEDHLQDLTHKDAANEPRSRRSHIHKYSKPTLQNDTIFISSISNPPSSEYKPHASQSRQIAMFLWVTLYWYFQQPEPSPYVLTEQSKYAPPEARPRGEWRIRIKREGVLRTRNMIPKLERMGLISSLDSAVGESSSENNHGWDKMFITRRAFWQIHSGLFLFTLQPLKHSSSYPGSPSSSRPTSPVRSDAGQLATLSNQLAAETPSSPIGPYHSSSHLPTFYPPAPLQYIITNNVRHPLRQKPPHMGEVFYTRFVPSVGKYLSFRVASLSPKPIPCLGPMGPAERENTHLNTLSDTSLLQMWLSSPRVQAFWGGYQPNFLSNALQSRHSFPAIGMWDGVPFGYFEIYWVKEDSLGRYMGNDAQDFDRGIHVLIGEEWARGRVQHWLSSIAHWCLQADYRTMNICLEPRVDNTKFIQHLQNGGFAKEREISFPHKRAWLCRLRRDAWDGPSM